MLGDFIQIYSRSSSPTNSADSLWSYQLTHKTMISRSKCRPANSSFVPFNSPIYPSSMPQSTTLNPFQHAVCTRAVVPFLLFLEPFVDRGDADAEALSDGFVERFLIRRRDFSGKWRSIDLPQSCLQNPCVANDQDEFYEEEQNALGIVR
jgi:hypothetical protein